MKSINLTFTIIAALITTSPAFAAEQDKPAPRYSSSLTSYQEQPRQSLSGLRHGSIDTQKFEEHVNYAMKTIRSLDLYKETLAYVDASNKQEALDFWRGNIEAELSESIDEKSSRFLQDLVRPIPYNRAVAPDELKQIAKKTGVEMMKLIEKDFDEAISRNQRLN